MEGMDTLDAAFDASTLPSKKKEPGTQIASRLSLWLRRSVWIVIGIVPPKGRGRLCGNRPCGEQFSSVSRKQNEILKCNLLPSEECQVVGGQLPQEAASTKRKSTLPGALSFGQLGQFRLAGTQATHLGKQKEPGTRIASRLSLVGRVVSLDLPSLFLGKHTNIHSPDIPNIL